MDPQEYFIKPRTTAQKQYLALAAYFKDELPAKEVAHQHGYTLPAFYSLVQGFRHRIRNTEVDPFFRDRVPGRKRDNANGSLERLIVSLRNRNFSNFDIEKALDAMGIRTSQPQIWRVLKRNGFQKLPRRTIEDRAQAEEICSVMGKKVPCASHNHGEISCK